MYARTRRRTWKSWPDPLIKRNVAEAGDIDHTIEAPPVTVFQEHVDFSLEVVAPRESGGLAERIDRSARADLIAKPSHVLLSFDPRCFPCVPVSCRPSSKTSCGGCRSYARHELAEEAGRSVVHEHAA